MYIAYTTLAKLQILLCYPNFCADDCTCAGTRFSAVNYNKYTTLNS